MEHLALYGVGTLLCRMELLGFVPHPRHKWIPALPHFSSVTSSSSHQTTLSTNPRRQITESQRNSPWVQFILNIFSIPKVAHCLCFLKHDFEVVVCCGYLSSFIICISQLSGAVCLIDLNLLSISFSNTVKHNVAPIFDNSRSVFF